MEGIKFYVSYFEKNNKKISLVPVFGVYVGVIIYYMLCNIGFDRITSTLANYNLYNEPTMPCTRWYASNKNLKETRYNNISFILDHFSCLFAHFHRNNSYNLIFCFSSVYWRAFGYAIFWGFSFSVYTNKLEGFPTREQATYSCPCEKHGFSKFSPHTCSEVMDIVERTPFTSVRQISNAVGITEWKSGGHCMKTNYTHTISKRSRFCYRQTIRLEWNSINRFQDSILFTDECTFIRENTINMHNLHM